MEQRTILRNIVVQLERNIIIIFYNQFSNRIKVISHALLYFACSYEIYSISLSFRQLCMDWIFRALSRVWFVENHFDYIDVLF